MTSRYLNWRNLLAIFAIIIVVGSVVLSRYLSKKIASEEKQKIEQWVEAAREMSSFSSTPTPLTSRIFTENSKDIPMIAVTEKDSILDSYNLDSTRIANDKQYLINQLERFKSTYPPVVWQNPYDSKQNNKIYYGDSKLLTQIKYFPLVQLLVMGLFIGILFYAINTRNKSTQNQVWAGMAKETAHQIGTPLSSLQGWVEMLKEDSNTEKIGNEMSKDVDRLKLVSDRFGKIGSTPQLEEVQLYPQIKQMMDYIKRRAPQSVQFNVTGEQDITAFIKPPLFDWVIENLLKTALDAMNGKGTISVKINTEAASVTVDVQDTGKGISKVNVGKVFNPGFTTKQRGWGLGLSLSKRIIDQYHKGSLFVKHSELGKGTCFRIVLNK